MRVVFVTREPLVHQFGGSTTAALNLLEMLVAKGCQVEMLVTSADSRSPRLFWKPRIALPQGVRLHVPEYRRLGKQWYILPFSPRAYARFFLRLATRSPALAWLSALVHRVYGQEIVADAWDLTPPGPREIALAEHFIAQQSVSVLVTNYAFWAPLLAVQPTSRLRRIVLMHDMLSARVLRFKQAGLALDCIDISQETEIEWLNQADIVLAIQGAEADAIRPLLNAEVLVQPIVLSPSETDPSIESDPNRCLFVGTRIQPNRTGMEWFLDAVWPLILELNPQASLHIAGSVCEVLRPGAPRTTLLGVVPSLVPEFHAAGVCLVPLLVGSGLKIKLLEALSFGKACVSTPIGVQGLEDLAEGVIEVAVAPKDFAAAVLRLMADGTLRRAREQAALALVRQHFGPQSESARTFTAKLLEIPPPHPELQPLAPSPEV